MKNTSSSPLPPLGPHAQGGAFFGPLMLTPKQRLFVAEYLVDLNATQAAIRAGYSAKTAKVIGAENLTKPAIAEAIQAAQQERLKATGITADRVLSEIARLAFGDVRKIFDESGRLLPVPSLPDEVAASVSSVKVTSKQSPGSDPVDVEYVTEIKFWDKKGSLELLGRHLKLFTDKSEVTLLNLEQLVAGAGK